MAKWENTEMARDAEIAEREVQVQMQKHWPEMQRRLMEHNASLIEHMTKAMRLSAPPPMIIDANSGYDIEGIIADTRRGIIWTGWEDAAKRNKKQNG